MVYWSDINILLHSVYLDQLSSSFCSWDKGFLLKFSYEFNINQSLKGIHFFTYISLFLNQNAVKIYISENDKCVIAGFHR